MGAEEMSESVLGWDGMGWDGTASSVACCPMSR